MYIDKYQNVGTLIPMEGELRERERKESEIVYVAVFFVPLLW